MQRCHLSAILIALILISAAAVAAFCILNAPARRETFADDGTGWMATKSSGGQGKGDTVLLVYASWCGHCKRLMEQGGTWDTVTARMSSIKFVDLDEASDEGKAAVRLYGIQGFPDIRAIRAGETVATYGGNRDVDDLVNWITDNVSPGFV